MITKVTEKNRVAYEYLFNEANAALEISSDSEAYINTLDKYFVQLKNLVTNVETRNNRLAFLRLPLDEPTFDIDTNTRAITVPAEFGKNGVSVQGDNAEILYFAVDRYFETMDLFSDDITVAIQWETPASRTAAAVNGISTALFRDCILLNNEEKVVFGWAINRKITQVAGAVKFAVRFFTLDNDRSPKFVLNTLPQQVKINASIGLDEFNFERPTVRDEQEIIDRLVASPLTPDSTLVDDPILKENLILGTLKEEDVDITQYDPETGEDVVIATVNLYEADLDPVTGELDLTVFAVTGPNGGNLAYEWKKIPLIVGDSVETDPGTPIMVRTTDEVYSDEYPYYMNIAEAGQAPVYTMVNPATYEAGTEIPEGLELFVKKNHAVVSTVGEYRVGVSAIKGGARKEVVSNIIRVPEPGDITLVQPAGDAAEVNVLLENGAANIVMKIADESNGDAAYFSLVKENEDDAWSATPVIVANGVAQSDFAAIEPADPASYYQKFIGKARVKRNKVTGDPIARTFVVAAPAAAPESVAITASSSIVNATHPVTLTATTNAVPEHYTQTYYWFDLDEKYVENTDILDWAAVKASADARYEAGVDGELVGNNTVMIVTNENTYTITNSGWYACRVRNNVFNGESNATSELPNAIFDNGELITTMVVHINTREGN